MFQLSSCAVQLSPSSSPSFRAHHVCIPLQFPVLPDSEPDYAEPHTVWVCITQCICRQWRATPSAPCQILDRCFLVLIREAIVALSCYLVECVMWKSLLVHLLVSWWTLASSVWQWNGTAKDVRALPLERENQAYKAPAAGRVSSYHYCQSHTCQSRRWLLLWRHLLSWPPLPSCLPESSNKVIVDILGKLPTFLIIVLWKFLTYFRWVICLYATNILSWVSCRMLETRRVGFQNICVQTVSYVADRTKFPIENLFVLHIFYVYSLKIILFYF